MKAARILIFPAGTENALELFESLRFSPHFEIYGGASVKDRSVIFYPPDRLLNLPYIHAPGFLAALNNAVTRYKLDLIFATHDTVLLDLIRLRSKIQAKVIGCDLFTAELCRYKDKLYRYFAGEDFIPSWTMNGKIAFQPPYFLKPTASQGAKGCEKMVAAPSFPLPKNVMLCEYLPGHEYTVDCFTDRKGQLLFVGPRTRDIIKMGISFQSKTCRSTEMERIAHILNTRLKFRGLWFFQIKERASKKPMLMEISSRIATSMGLYRQLGVNLPLLSAYDALDMDVEPMLQEFPITLERVNNAIYRLDLSYETVFVDYDDTITVHGQVNSRLIAFLYQSLNKGKKIVLLTRHEGDIMAELSCRHISPSIFGQIIHLEPGEDKFPYVSGEAIYIDNMFHDRQKVSREKHIPVFDADAVSCLLEP